MAMIVGLLELVCCLMVALVYAALFWVKTLKDWLRPETEERKRLRALQNAQDFDAWEAAAEALDQWLDNNKWRNTDESDVYNYKLINERYNSLKEATDRQDVNRLIEIIRSGLVRNLGGITNPELYNHSYEGTKYLIESYINRMMGVIGDIGSLPTTTNEQEAVVRNAYSIFHNRPLAQKVIASEEYLITQQEKLDTTRQLRQAFGVSTLVMQGGSIFGLCHLGVAKALFQCGLLPHIITGTGTGALIAALIGIHADRDLDSVLSGEKINLTAFSGPSFHRGYHSPLKQNFSTRLATLKRRVSRFWRDGHFLDIRILEQCVRDNCGNLTFEEAFIRSGRVLNITVATGDKAGIPRVLNYIITPHVLVWSAAVASNATDAAWYGEKQTQLLCKNVRGEVEPWAPAAEVRFRHWTQASYQGRNSPLQRLCEHFNVNHYIVSQARPYMVPFLQSDMHGPSSARDKSVLGSLQQRLITLGNGIAGFVIRYIKLRLTQLDMMNLMPPSIRRLLLDETIPTESMTLVPQLEVFDFVKLLDAPTSETLQYWIKKGELSVWPAIGALKVRCGIEYELENAFNAARESMPRRSEAVWSRRDNVRKSNEVRQRMSSPMKSQSRELGSPFTGNSNHRPEMASSNPGEKEGLHVSDSTKRSGKNEDYSETQDDSHNSNNKGGVKLSSATQGRKPYVTAGAGG